MPEIESMPTVTATAAEQAVRRILHRVVNDRDFSWVMIGTESLRMCLTAEAERRAKPEEEVEADLYKAMETANVRLRRSKADRARVEILEERLQKLEREANRECGDMDEDTPPPRLLAVPAVVLDRLREMYDAGEISSPEYRQIIGSLQS